MRKRIVSNQLNARNDFAELNELEGIVEDIRRILTTIKGSYPYNPEFGTNVNHYVFEPNDQITISAFKKDLISTIKMYVDAPINLFINADFIPNEDGSASSVIVAEITITYLGQERKLLYKVGEEYVNVLKSFSDSKGVI